MNEVRFAPVTHEQVSEMVATLVHGVSKNGVVFTGLVKEWNVGTLDDGPEGIIIVEGRIRIPVKGLASIKRESG